MNTDMTFNWHEIILSPLKEARQSQTTLIFSICLGLIAGIFGILQAREVSKLIGQVFLHGERLASVSGLLLAVLVIVVLRAGFIWAGELSASKAAQRIKQTFRNQLYTHITDIGPAYLRSRQVRQNTDGELVNLATEGVEALEPIIASLTLKLHSVLVLGYLDIRISLDSLSGVVLLVTAPCFHYLCT
jgi:ABC-type transport system involved in cytochrome bd biosynthesis fused ATPase/permease subunit